MYAHVHVHGGKFRVTLDGEDVSAECFAASEERGYALCYVYAWRRDLGARVPQMEIHRGARRLKREMRRGVVRIEPLAPPRTPAHLERPLAPNY
jgi:hypothetical protein